ncbi:MAG: hypothetical protein ABEK01_03165 [Candidatus Nanohaloarchaea archaeon]
MIPDPSVVEEQVMEKRTYDAFHGACPVRDCTEAVKQEHRDHAVEHADWLFGRVVG